MAIFKFTIYCFCYCYYFCSLLLAVQLNNQLFLYVLWNAFTLRIGNECAFELSFIPIQPIELIIFSTNMAGDSGIRLSAFLETHDITGFELERWNICNVSVDGNMFMCDQLPRSGT